MTINETAQEIHREAIKRGFYDDIEILTRSTSPEKVKSANHMFFAQQVALVMTELAEAIEADRNGFVCPELPEKMTGLEYGGLVKGTRESEICDAISRLFDIAARLGIDIERHLTLKAEYNNHREYKHGKNY